MLVTVSLLLAAACLVPAFGKLLGHPKMRRSAAHFGIAWRRYQFIGMAELGRVSEVDQRLGCRSRRLLYPPGMITFVPAATWPDLVGVTGNEW